MLTELSCFTDAATWCDVASSHEPITCHRNLDVCACCMGIGEYKSLPTLANSTSDAQAMADGFSQMDASHGVAITSGLRKGGNLIKGLKEQLFPIIRQHISTLRVIVTYMACHGLQIGSEMFLAPEMAYIDWEEEDPEEKLQGCVSLKRLVNEMTKEVRDARSNSDARSNPPCVCVFILDTCRDRVDEGLVAHAPVEVDDFSKPDRDVEFVFLFSTWKGDTACDGSTQEGHSPYTSALLEHLFKHNVTLGGQLSEVEKAMKTGQQVPAQPKASAKNMEELVLFKSKGAAAETALPEDAEVIEAIAVLDLDKFTEVDPPDYSTPEYSPTPDLLKTPSDVMRPKQLEIAPELWGMTLQQLKQLLRAIRETDKYKQLKVIAEHLFSQLP